jgi:cold shock protein
VTEGRVKTFNVSRGYGFVTDADGRDYYFHHSDIEGEGFKTVPEGARALSSSALWPSEGCGPITSRCCREPQPVGRAREPVHSEGGNSLSRKGFLARRLVRSGPEGSKVTSTCVKC